MPTEEILPPVGELQDFRDPQDLRNRFRGITPSSFSDGFSRAAIFAMCGSDAPDGFEVVWCSFRPEHAHGKFSSEERQLLQTVVAVLACCDAQDPEHMLRAVALSNHIRQLGNNYPPMILVHHSKASLVHPVRVGDADLEALCQARHQHIDHVILGEPACLRLVMDVRSALALHIGRQLALQAHLSSIATRSECYERFKEMHKQVVWEYLRVNMEAGVPRIDNDIGKAEQGSIVGGYKLGQLLGTGAFGRVHRLEDPRTSSPTDEVLKVIPKTTITSCDGIKKLRTQIQVMRLLSTAEYEHPNVTKLLDVYHSHADVHFRLNYAGPMNLYKRLKYNDDERRPLAENAVACIMAQCIEAVSHLHVVANVVHRDIKLDNFIVAEDPQSVRVMLTDFDLASAMPEDAVCSGMNGTIPFMAPEVVRNRFYRPYPADIWSMGIVCLEILCGADVLRESFRSKRLMQRKRCDVELMERIFSFFHCRGNVRNFLGRHLHPELSGLRESANVLLDGMLMVTVYVRWTAVRLREQIRTGCAYTSS